MLVALLFWLCLLIIVLVILAIGLMQYVVLPAALLRLFFRSTWAPSGLKHVVGWTLGVLALLLVAGFGWSRHHQAQARREADVQLRLPPIELTARQPGLLPFRLGRGHIEEARYDTARWLVVSGDLSVGGRLRARFSASPGFAPAHETNTVSVSTEDGAATQATGRSAYDPGERTVSGSFRCVLPSGKPLSVSFPPTAVGRY